VQGKPDFFTRGRDIKTTGNLPKFGNVYSVKLEIPLEDSRLIRFWRGVGMRSDATRGVDERQTSAAPIQKGKRFACGQYHRGESGAARRIRSAC